MTNHRHLDIMNLVSGQKVVLNYYVKFIYERDMQKLAEKYGLQNNICIYTAIERILKSGASVDVADDKGDTALHTVLKQFKDEKLISLLLKYSQNINCRNGENYTPLDIVLQNYIKYPNQRSMCLSVLKDIVSKSADDTIHFAIYKNFVDILQTLEEKVDFQILATSGDNALHLVSKTHKVNRETINYLLIQGYDVSVTNKDAMAPIHLACQSGNLLIIGVLLNLGIDVNCREERLQRTPLHLATEASAAEVIEFLLHRGADINARDGKGETALLKVNFKRMDLIRMLLKWGADSDIKDSKNRNLLHRAVASDETLDMKELFDLGININHLNFVRELRTGNWFKDNVTRSILQVQIIKLETAELLSVAEIFQPYIAGTHDSRNLCLGFVEKIHYVHRLRLLLQHEKFVLRRICLKEIAKVKAYLINHTTSIYDFLHMSPSRQVAHLRNDVLTGLVLPSSDIEEIFPRYCGIIRATYYAAAKRHSLTDAAHQVFLDLCDFPLPDLCTEKIFNYLSNEDLENMIRSLDLNKV